jgi:DUF1009 family protein
MGLIAGWGRYPLAVAEALRKRGKAVYCLAVHGHADPRLRDLCDDVHSIGLARLGRGIRYFRRHGVTQATMAGKIHKVLLFQRFYWFKHFPDWCGMRTFFPHFVSRTRDRRDDTLLMAVVEMLARHGIMIFPAIDYAPDLLVEPGLLSGRRLTDGQRKDIDFGWRLAAEMGRLDVGQCVAVKGGAVLAVEAVEGTDGCIRRAGQLCQSGGFTVVKIAKPHQDMRFDVPTVGIDTLRTMAESGAKLLAIQAGKTIMLDRPEVLHFARRRRIKIVSLEEGSLDASLKFAA